MQVTKKRKLDKIKMGQAVDQERLFNALSGEFLTFMPTALIRLILDYGCEFEGRLIHQWGCERPKPSIFSYPRGIASFREYVYIVDQSNQIIVINYSEYLKNEKKMNDSSFDSSKIIKRFSGFGSGSMELENPNHLAVFDNTLFITDYLNHRIQKWDLILGQFIGEIKCQGSCCGIAIYRSEIYVTVASLMSHQIVVYNMKGVEIRKWGRHGSSDGEFIWPWGLAITDDIVYVADSNNHRISLFTLEGTFLQNWGGGYGKLEGQFIDPRAIVVKEEYLYISDKHYIHQYNRQGKFIKRFGGEKVLDGCEQFCFVDRYCFVANRGNNQIKIFR